MQVKWENSPFGTVDLEPNAAEGYRSAKSLLRKENEVRCCVRNCGTWLPARLRKTPPHFCPEHGISVSKSPTYVYKDWRRNFLLRHDLIAAVKQHKVESWRLGNESSEDALNWNLFVGLAHLGGLREAFETLTGQSAQAEPQLFFWGIEVWPVFNPSTWTKLNEARTQFGEQSFEIPTEPDVMLRVAGQAIVLVEAKFGSPNGTLAKKKGATVSKFLGQYHAIEGKEDPLDREAIGAMEPNNVLEQLCRNVVFSNYLADGGEAGFVVNLVLEGAEIDVGERLNQHLITSAHTKFRRVTWEQLCQLPTMQRDEAATLRRYMLTKTLRLRPAFNIGERMSRIC